MEAIDKAVDILLKSGCDSVVFSRKEAVKDVEDILMSVLRIKREQLIIQYKQELPSVYEGIFFSNVNDRKKGKPLAYITRSAVFYAYNFFVNESCLIPRIDSEILVEKAEEYILHTVKRIKAKSKVDGLECNKHDINIEKANTIKIIDACCGSGCLGISLVKSIIDGQKSDNKLDIFIELTLLDVSPSAIKVAQLNAQCLLSKYVDAVKVKYVVCDILQSGIGNDLYDIILCNPPYIEADAMLSLDKQVKDYEPHLALDGGADGLKFYRAFQQILKLQKQKYLYDKQRLFGQQVAFFEIGYNQGDSVSKLFSDIGYDVEIIKDFGKQNRVVIVK